MTESLKEKIKDQMISPSQPSRILASNLQEQEARRMIFWNECDPFIDERMQWRASMIRHLFHILPGARILEIGAGNGKFTRALTKVLRDECEITSVVFSSVH